MQMLRYSCVDFMTIVKTYTLIQSIKNNFNKLVGKN